MGYKLTIHLGSIVNWALYWFKFSVCRAWSHSECSWSCGDLASHPEWLCLQLCVYVGCVWVSGCVGVVCAFCSVCMCACVIVHMCMCACVYVCMCVSLVPRPPRPAFVTCSTNAHWSLTKDTCHCEWDSDTSCSAWCVEKEWHIVLPMSQVGEVNDKRKCTYRNPRMQKQAA